MVVFCLLTWKGDGYPTPRSDGQYSSGYQAKGFGLARTPHFCALLLTTAIWRGLIIIVQSTKYQDTLEARDKTQEPR